MTKRSTFLIAVVVFLAALIVLFRVDSSLTAKLWSVSRNGTWLLPLVAVSALIDSINPCAFSILLLTIAFLMSLGKERAAVLKIGGAYIFGIFLIYVLIGLGILQALHLFNTPHFMAKVAAAILVALGGLSVINEFFPSFPIKLRIPHAAHTKIAQLMEVGSIPAAFGLGALVGLCEFPCTGGPYLLVLGLLHDTQTYVRGLGYLTLYNLVFILPLAIILFVASEPALLERVKAWKKENNQGMRLWGGIAMILLGVAIFFL